MSAETFWETVLSWANEDSHRGRVVRAFQSNMGDSAELQAQRVGILCVYMEREAIAA
ncbi:hypothetical protein [Streptomyces cinereoruber]|uniref:hypothetical protein n=1 Tax=Streptomyces cinereoruber TaxID=67260 RepID=UPI00339478DC